MRGPGPLPCVLALAIAGCHEASTPDTTPDTTPDAGLDAGPDPRPEPFVLAETVRTAEGPIRGAIEEGLVVFRGIPYAAPPVGGRRFRPPEPHPPWTEEREAVAFGFACPQAGDAAPADEDCLTLNVWAHPEDGGRPVLVFLHGGGFLEGSSALPAYDGRTVAADTGAVVVTINYRLGALGYLATSALAAESGDGSAGNYGVRDQIAALAWVQANVARFGGDPKKVLAFGESAGGSSVCALAASPAAGGTYAALGIESGPCTLVGDLDAPSWTGIAAKDAGDAFVESAGCGGADSLACLRALPAEDLVAAQSAVPPGAGKILGAWLTPIVDGVTVVEPPFAALAHNGAPLLVGANRDEMTLFLTGVNVPDEAAYHATLDAFYGSANGAKLAEAYPASGYPTPKDALLEVMGDVTFNCVAESAAIAHEASGAATHLYAFDRSWEGAFAPFGAFHIAELVAIFGTFSSFSYAPTEDDRRVGLLLRTAWAREAELGHPGIEAWPAFSSAVPSSFFQIDAAGEGPGAIWRGGRCPMLRSLGLVP